MKMKICPNCNNSKMGVISPYGMQLPCSWCLGEGQVMDIPAPGWIGVDLDGTFAEDKAASGVYTGEIGLPVYAMVCRVKRWLRQGIEVKIFTARVCPTNRDGARKTILAMQLVREKIGDYCEKVVGKRLDITCEKDYAMVQLWDDRAVQVVKNTGERVGNIDR